MFPPLPELDGEDWSNKPAPCGIELESPELPVALELGCSEVMVDSPLSETLVPRLVLPLVLSGDDEVVDLAEVFGDDGESDDVLFSDLAEVVSSVESRVLEVLCPVDATVFVLPVLEDVTCVLLPLAGLFSERI